MAALEAKKYYTVEEANQALPLVRAIVSDIVAKYGEVSERKARLDQIRQSRHSAGRAPGDMYREELQQVEEELDKEITRLQEFIEELDDLGVELKDIGRGLVDFRTMLDGREVYLCWLLGEEEIGHWHELDAGFAGRQSLLAGSASDGGSAGGAGED
jgi:hypothetical protein